MCLCVGVGGGRGGVFLWTLYTPKICKHYCKTLVLVKFLLMFFSVKTLNVFSIYFWTSQIAARVGVRSDAVKKVVIWGNHSSTQFPDVSHASVEVEGKTLPVYEAVKDDAWIEGEFITVSGDQ